MDVVPFSGKILVADQCCQTIVRKITSVNVDDELDMWLIPTMARVLTSTGKKQKRCQ